MDKQIIKIALISFQQDADRVPPVGLVYLATYLKEKLGIENIKIIDKNYHDIEKELEEYLPDLVGVGAMTVDYGEVLRFAKNFKQKHSTPIIIGGVHISTLPESFEACFDVGVIGEGEQTLAELINLFLEKGKFEEKDLAKIKSTVFFYKGKLAKTPLRENIELDSLPFPDFSFVNPDYFKEKEVPGTSEIRKKYYILSSRGCPYQCVFCSTTRFWSKVRLHSPDYVAELIKQGIENYGANHFAIMDDLFTINKERLRELRKSFEKYGLLDKIKGIEVQPRANLIDDEMCQLMKDINIKIVNFGFESGSEKMLKWLKGDSVTVEMNRQAVILCKSYGLQVYGSLMFGSPGETIEDIKQTLEFIDFVVENKARYVWSFVATPFPATPFWNIALERGRVSNHMDWDILSHHNLDNPLLLDENIDREEFKKLFLQGRKKLRKLKFIIIKDFIKSHPFRAVKMLATEPAYYIGRFVKQVYKQ